MGTVVVVLGASGDLAKKKTFPALFGLYRNGFLPKDVKIVGYARTKMDHEEYLKRVKSYIKTPTKDIEQQLDEFCKFSTYVAGQYDKDESFRELDRALRPNWKEEETFRIDHYLGKEMVKNILILRFGNEFFGATWNRNHIDNVQITFKEPFGTEGRGGYFDEFGIIRDVMQNHLLQVLTLLAMERPISFSAEDVRDEKVRVLRGIPAIEPKNVIIGQYGKSLDRNKPSYKEDDTVPKDSG